MRVQLFLTCLCDAFYGEVGIAATRVLEHAGCRVEFPEGQTCCGQPPFNAGDWNAARPVAQRLFEVFEPGVAIVTPSASCAAMLRHGNPMLGLPEVPVYELATFLIEHLGLDRWPLAGNRVSWRRRAAYHRACHGRTLGLGDTVERLLSLVKGLELVPFEQADQCCGFGGAFSVGHPTVSAGIGTEKLRCLLDAGIGTVLSGDMGCLMHLQGLIERARFPLQTRHYAQVLAEALD